MRKSFLWIWILAVVSIMQIAVAGNLEYTSPKNQSILNARRSPVIIRPGEMLDAASIDFAGQIVVKNGESILSGSIKLSSDGKTLVFTPDQPYEPDAEIQVTFAPGVKTVKGNTIQGASFSFKVTPLAEPLNAYENLPELSPLPSLSMNIEPTIEDDLPSDFPRFTISVPGTPAEGDIFLSPTSFIDLDGYNLIIKNSGDLRYYVKISDGAPVDFKVLPNGRLSYGSMMDFNTFSGGGPSVFHVMDSSFTIVDDYQMGNGYTADSHEFQMLPNGHVLMLCYDLQPVDMSAIVEGGHPGALVAGSIIQELDHEHNVIFQWRSWDYFDIADSYNDLTLAVFDAIHVNSIELDTDNNLLLSTMALAEITKISRQTGDILWRMGGQNNEFTFINENQDNAPVYFMGQHDVRRLDNGNILMFDGGESSLRAYSRIVEYTVDETAKTATKVWEYRHNPDVFTGTMGSAQRLSNGNTLICWGMASMYGGPSVTEVDPAGNVQLELKYNTYLLASYRAFKYEWDGGKPVNEVMVTEVAAPNSYSFDRDGQTPGISIKMKTLTGPVYNEVYARRYHYAPLSPSFPGKAPSILPMRVTMEFRYISQMTADISFDVAGFGFDDPENLIVYFREFEGSGLFIPLSKTYNHVTGKIIVPMSTLEGEFAFGYADVESTANPPILVSPENNGEADISRDVTLAWSPIGFATYYDLQVATEETFASPIVNETYLSDAVYSFTPAASPTTYYWRVATRNDAGLSDWSATYSFGTTAPYIKVTVPNGGESWQLGLPHFIQWEDLVGDSVIIELYKNGAFSETIDKVANSGGYAWDISPYMDQGTDYQILIKNEDGSVQDLSDAMFTIMDETAVDPTNEVVRSFALHQNYPNPFNPKTQIRYELQEAGHVSLVILDSRGQTMRTLVNGILKAGEHSVTFDAEGLPTGLYFYRLKSVTQTITKKCLYLK